MKSAHLHLLIIVILAVSCSKKQGGETENPEIIIPAGQQQLSVDRLALFSIKPEIKNLQNPSWQWIFQDEIISTIKDLDYYIAIPGKYTLTLTAKAGAVTLLKNITITVKEKEYSPLIATVFDFLQAPGQFVNTSPDYISGDTRQSMTLKANQAIAGKTDGLLNLGGYGGYVVFGFDHLVMNKKESADFKVYGNAFENYAEPGIVQVSIDANANGLPDDDWYELAGSEYAKPATIKNYSITYTRPEFLNDSVSWTDNQGKSGKVFRNEYHQQTSYFPLYFSGDELTLTGTLLAPNGKHIGVSPGDSWELPAYGWGYADNQPNAANDAGLDIDWAVNSVGEKVKLIGIHFVKVYTGTNQDTGWLGEASSEISGAIDLNLQ